MTWALTLAAWVTMSAAGDDLHSTRAPVEHPVPAWLPRDASLGLTVNSGLVSGQLRVGWQVTLYERGGHDLLAVLVLGTGLSFAQPAGMTTHYQHVALLGFGYRNVSDFFNWGFQWGIGADWYRVGYDRYPFENRVVPYTEGRVQLGLRAARALVLGLFGGYAAPVVYDSRHTGQTYAGGIIFGLYADWR